MIRHSGIGTYLRGLLGEFRSHPHFERHSLGLAVSRGLLPEIEGAGQPLLFNAPIYSLWEQMEYPFQLARCRLWHAPHYNIPLIKGKARLIVTIHDLIHWIFRKEFYSPPQAAYAGFLFQQVVRSADRMIVVSRQTGDDLVQFFKAPPEKIRVIYEGVQPAFFETPDPAKREALLEKYKLPRRFFLYVGLIKPHKNVKRLVLLFKRLRAEKRIDSSLVLVGKKDRKYPRGFELLKEIQTGDGIHYLPQVESMQELACLYASARALVHPSLYEGFGLTCLEAMASGTPVLVSEAASLPEVVGEAGYFVDPYSDASLRQGLLEMEENDTLRRDLGEKGKIQARQFNWAKTARETLRVYEEVLGTHPR
jgi:glycosyltransferase involved in cell wall biosynthesis